MLRFELETIQEENLSCRSCSLRRVDNPVCGQGNINAKLMIIGEYPSPNEVLVGRPFEERSGILLKNILEKASINCDNTYITYTVRCNANSAKQAIDHVKDCKKWLWEELRIIQPKIVLTLGKIPTKLLLKPKSNYTLKNMVGNSYNRDFLPNTLIVPWYSPSTLLQRGAWFTEQTIKFFKTLNEILNVNKA